jgi:thiol-disulfide isomerase/thioredoxin
MKAWISITPALPAQGWQQVLAAHRVAVAVCWTPWAQADFAMAPILRGVQPEYPAIAFFSADIAGEGAELAQWFSQYHTPALLCFFGGQHHDTHVGFMNEDALRAKLREWLEAST